MNKFVQGKEKYISFRIINSFMMEIPLSYRIQSIDLQRKSMDWFLYDMDVRHESVKEMGKIKL